MSDFMQREIEFGDWYEIDTRNGITVIPADIVGDAPTAAEVLQYLDVFRESDVYKITKRTGFGARLSAPGYLDCTEWSVFDTEKEAAEYLEEMYGCDNE